MGAAFEVNRQMCDIGRLISVEEMAERYNKQISQSRLDGLSAWLKLQDMEEKKTKKMTKAEAFEYLKGKKVYVNSHSAHIQATLFEAGYTWSSGNRNIDNEDMPFLLTTNHGEFFTICNMREFAKVDYEEISADDILSIEIIEDTRSVEDRLIDLAKPIMALLHEQGMTDSVRITSRSIVLEPMATFLYGQILED